MQKEIKKDALILKETINGNEIVWTIKATFGGLKVKGENKTENKKSETYYKWYWSWNRDKNDEFNIDFYDKSYKHLPDVIRKICEVKNETDSMTDYFENDHFELRKNHPLFKIAADAIIIIFERYIKKTEKSKYWTPQTRADQIKSYKEKIEEIKFYLLTLNLWEYEKI